VVQDDDVAGVVATGDELAARCGVSRRRSSATVIAQPGTWTTTTAASTPDEAGARAGPASRRSRAPPDGDSRVQREQDVTAAAECSGDQDAPTMPAVAASQKAGVSWPSSTTDDEADAGEAMASHRASRSW